MLHSVGHGDHISIWYQRELKSRSASVISFVLVSGSCVFFTFFFYFLFVIRDGSYTSRSKDPTQNPSISQDPAQNPGSPYYLHAGENPGTVLINLQLDGNNYHPWSRVMRRALLSKNKHKFINGTLPAPKTGTSLQETWEQCNMMVISWVTRTLSEQIAQSVVYVEDAREL